MNVPLTKTINMKRKASKKIQNKSISGVSSHPSNNTSISRRTYLSKKRKNKSLKISKIGSEKPITVKHCQTKIQSHNISHMSNSPSFQKFNKPRQQIAQQIKKPKFGRSSSEPVKEPIQYQNMSKVGRKKSECVGGTSNLGVIILKNPNKSLISEHIKSVLPTPTIKLSLENAESEKIFNEK